MYIMKRVWRLMKRLKAYKAHVSIPDRNCTTYKLLSARTNLHPLLWALKLKRQVQAGFPVGSEREPASGSQSQGGAGRLHCSNSCKTWREKGWDEDHLRITNPRIPFLTRSPFFFVSCNWRFVTDTCGLTDIFLPGFPTSSLTFPPHSSITDHQPIPVKLMVSNIAFLMSGKLFGFPWPRSLA